MEALVIKSGSVVIPKSTLDPVDPHYVPLYDLCGLTEHKGLKIESDIIFDVAESWIDF